jgi:hypothetical protein
MIPKLLDLLKKCNILFESENFINGMIIPREILLSKDKFIQLTNEIMEIKKNFSSSRLTSLQKTAKDNQKWPLLNLVRQLLKASGYKMIPKRQSDGYNKEGKKKFKRFFILEKINNEIKEEIKTEIKEVFIKE